MQKYLTYLNTALILLLVVYSPFWHKVSSSVLGAAPSTASTFYDINLDSANGIGGATIYANGTSLLSPTTLGVATANLTTLNVTGVATLSGAGNLISGSSTISATTTATGQFTLSCSRVYQLGATTNASTTYYLVASTTAFSNLGFSLYATSTKPTICP